VDGTICLVGITVNLISPSERDFVANAIQTKVLLLPVGSQILSSRFQYDTEMRPMGLSERSQLLRQFNEGRTMYGARSTIPCIEMEVRTWTMTA
jgi:hypothetical protein